MNIDSYLRMDLISTNETLSSKKKVLERLSELARNTFPEFSEKEIFDSFIQRERLGSTGIGHGIALPHGRLESNEQTIGIFLSLTEGINFDAIDNEPVRIFFALLIPHDSSKEHLQVLAKLAEFFRVEENRNALLDASSNETAYNILSKI